jgi:hypothetical protein
VTAPFIFANADLEKRLLAEAQAAGLQSLKVGTTSPSLCPPFAGTRILDPRFLR